jgi:uncharacterized membrane protein YeaQ/YmgE (transglycosylase-associated protein family)
VVSQTILIGLIVGGVASLVMRGRTYGLVMDLIEGLIGAVTGVWLFHAAGIAPNGAVGPMAMSVLGAALVVVASRLIAAL